MQIVYDDIIYSLQKAGGISIYWSYLEDYIDYDYRLLYKNHNKNIFYKDYDKSKNVYCHKNLTIERMKSVKFDSNEPFIFHSSYYRYCANKNAVNITTVHDFINEYYRHDLKSMLHKIQKKNAVFHSKAVICNSENTKKDFLKFYPDYAGEIKVIFLGGTSADYSTRLKVPRKHKMLYIGARKGYKNFAYALKIMERLPKTFTLQIIGGGILSQNETSSLEKFIPGRYEYFNNLSNRELNKKYNEAYFLLYPSLYEGFGVPVVEAQSAGCPVVCCNVSSLPEVGGDAALYMSGINIEDDLRIISQLENNDFYQAIQEKGYANSKKFTWKNCAEQTYEFYQEIYNKNI